MIREIKTINMVTRKINNENVNVPIVELRGLSTDTPPTNVGGGSSFYTIDTKKLYLFNEVNNQWVEQ